MLKFDLAKFCSQFYLYESSDDEEDEVDIPIVCYSESEDSEETQINQIEDTENNVPETSHSDTTEPENNQVDNDNDNDNDNSSSSCFVATERRNPIRACRFTQKYSK